MAAKAVATKNAASKSFIDFKSVIFWVLAIVFFCYANSLTNGYNMDDEIVTINHPLTSKGLSAIPDILKSPYFQSDIYSYEYRPIVHISFAIEHQFLGESPFVSHLINLLLYLLLIYVAFNLLKQLFPAVNQTIIAAIVLVFALHPTHTEVVASIKNRDEILALLFSFLAWREAIKFVTTKQWWRILFVVLLFNLAMGSKVTVIPMVFIIPLSIWLLLEKVQTKTIILSFSLGATSILWYQISDIKIQIFLTLLLPAFFVLVLAIKNIVKIRGLFKINDVKVKSETSGGIISNFELLIWVKGNKYLLGLILLVNIFAVGLGSNFFAMVILVLLPIILSLFSSNLSKGLWFFLSALLSVEYALLLGSTEISEVLLTYAFMMFGFLLFENYLSIFVLLAVIVFSTFVSIQATYSTTFLFQFHQYRIKGFKFGWVMLLATGIAFVFEIISYDGNNIELLKAGTFFILIFLLNCLDFFKEKKKDLSLNLILTYFVVSTVGFVILSEFPTKQKYFFKPSYTKIIAQSSKVNIVPNKSYRPVLFAEFPIDLINDDLETKLGTSSEVLLKYLKLTLLPYPLSFYYGYSEIKPVSVNSLLPIISIIIHILLLIAIALSFRRNKLIAFGILIYLISIAPFSALVAPIPGVMADRYLFAPTLGFAMVLVGIIIWLSKIDWLSKLSGISVFPKNARYVLSAVLLVYASLTIARNNDWKDRLTLFRNDIFNVPNSAQAHNLLAYHLNRTAQEVTDPFERKKLMEEAVFHFQRATEIWPEFMNATYDLGRTHEQLGNWNQAIAAYKRTFEIDTSFSDAIFRMGIVYEAENKLDSAIIAYQYVTEDNPLNITAFNNLSYCYFKKQEYRSAIETGRRSSFHHPTNTDPIVNIGKTFLHIKESDSALYYFEKVYPNRANDKGLTEVLYKLWNEKGNMERATFYYRRMQIMGMVK